MTARIGILTTHGGGQSSFGGIFGNNKKVTDNSSNTTFKNDKGGASRFFYCAKASKSERNVGCEGLEDQIAKRTMAGGEDTRGRPTPVNNNNHPTVKPLALMEYLCNLTKTPSGGTVLDPFAGSGTTGIACVNTSRPYTLVERNEDYCRIIAARLGQAWFDKIYSRT